MAGGYDGSIRIDTSINTQPLSSGLNAIEGKIKGLAGSIGVIFGTKELIEFGGTAITAASDLQEAQNVVDTAFGTMSHKMEQFADTALDVYGISELTAKQMGSTYMAMAKGMGVATNAASDMAVTLTGRLSDIMSFYNKTQSEVDTIGRAIITGETEPIKAIGVVMTQANLAAYTMAEGFGKAYEEMSASEQLIVRYKYFLEQTALAQGDFAKTSEGWANQTRTLNERFGEFMTNLGGVLMNTFTPAIRFANEAVAFINDLFFGGNAEETATAKNAAEVADEVSAVGTAAEKSEKKLNSLMSGFDELHVISGAKNDNSSELNTTAIDTSDLLGVSLEVDTSLAKKAANKYREILNEIYLAFKRHPLTKIIGEIIDSIGDFFGVIKDNGDIDYGGMVTLLMDLLGALLMFKGVSGVVGAVKTFSSGFGGLLKVVTAHPVAAIAVGIAALATGIYLVDKELKRQEIASHFGDISISLEEIDELVSPISDDMTVLADAFAESRTKISDAKDNFDHLSDAIQGVFDSLKNGEKVDGSITKQIDEWIDAALGYNEAALDNSAMRALALSDGVISAEEQSVLDSYDELGSSITEKVEVIRSQIHEITQAAADENRALMESELKNIQDMYDQIARMTAAQGDIKTAAVWERLISRAYTYDSYDVLLDEITKAREQSEASAETIEKAAYEQMMSHLAIMEANGYSDEEISAEKTRQIALINDSLKEKQQESLLYEKRLLDAFGEAHYSFTEADALEKVTDQYFSTDSEKQKFRDYYELYKKMQATGNQKYDLDALAQALGDETYSWAISAIAGMVKEMDGTYGEWGAEQQAVVAALGELGWESGDSYAAELVDVIENADTLDGTKLLSDVSTFTRLGVDSGQAYVDAIMEYLEKSNLGMVLDTSKGYGNFDSKLYGWEAYYGNYADAWWQNTSASYGQQPLTAGYIPEIKTETTTNINLSVNGVTQERMSFVGPVNNAEITLRSNGTR